MEFGEPLDRIWRDCLLRYCGVQRTIRQVFRIIATSSVRHRDAWLREAPQIIDDAVFGNVTNR
ncbi:MAG: FMN-dependent NADH-azoreductase [Edaphobacter sp.]|jgi:NAD(P)H dehydrogenase (quinone)|nr:FMN-dependent NADH-azoreductase [Edaphobacter sp.]